MQRGIDHLYRGEVRLSSVFRWIHPSRGVAARSHDLYNPIVLYATSRAVTYDPSATTVLKFKDASVSDQHWSVRARKR